MENSPGKTGGTAVVKESQKETQEQKVRLQIVLLFYDHTDSEWGKTLEDGFVCIQESKQLTKVPFEIEGIESSNNEILKQYLLPIKEIIEIPKGKKSSEITKLQQIILDLVKFEICSNSNKIILDILCPTDNKTIGQKDIYLTFLFDKSFAKQLSRYIDVKKSTISLLYPLEDKPNDSNNTSKDEDKSPKDENKPTKLDVKIAALMSHYVYFYLDWLEYYHVHVNGIGKRIMEKVIKKKNEVNDVIEIINEFNIINGFFAAGFNGIITIGETKVKGRIINRLREIARASNYLKDNKVDNLYCSFNEIVSGKEKDIEDFTNSIFDSIGNKKDESIQVIIKNKISKELQKLKAEHNKTKNDNDRLINKENFKKFINDILALDVYVDILLYCKENKRPVGFYDLYDKFGYWDYLKDQDLKEEAKHWYVSHPYIIYKNDYAKLEKKAKDNSVSIDAQKPYKKILWVLPRKTDEIFIAIDEKLLKNCDAKMSENQNAHEKLSETNNHIETVEKRWLVYNTVLTHGMDQLSGYGGLLFTKVDENGKAKKFAYCTKGTDVNSLNDWLFVDVLQGVTGFSLQHLHNVKNAITINKKVEEYDNKTPLFYCGHSLGGGLASACAIASKGRHAITFNAAGLNFLGVLATRTIGGFNYGLDVTNKVHPIRIDGEAIDALMVFSFIVLAHLNERAYGNAELILKLKGRGLGSFFWLANLDEMGAKHGINNFLYKPLMDALDIVDKKTIKYPVEDVNLKNTSIASLGSDQFDMVDKTDGRVFISGNYVLKFKNSNNEPVVYKSILKCSYEDVMKLFSEVHIKKLHPSMKESAKKYLRKMYGFECPD